MKIDITDTTQVFKILMGLKQVLKFQMFRWMLPQRDLWIAHEHGGVQVDASTEGLIAACEHILSFRWMLLQRDLQL